MAIDDMFKQPRRDATHDRLGSVDIEARQNDQGHWLAYWGSPERRTMGYTTPQEAIAEAKIAIKAVH